MSFVALQIPHSILWMVGMFVIREIPMIPFSLFRNFGEFCSTSLLCLCPAFLLY